VNRYSPSAVKKATRYRTEEFLAEYRDARSRASEPELPQVSDGVTTQPDIPYQDLRNEPAGNFVTEFGEVQDRLRVVVVAVAKERALAGRRQERRDPAQQSESAPRDPEQTLWMKARHRLSYSRHCGADGETATFFVFDLLVPVASVIVACSVPPVEKVVSI
jgi:hypothetical protein